MARPESASRPPHAGGPISPSQRTQAHTDTTKRTRELPLCTPFILRPSRFSGVRPARGAPAPESAALFPLFVGSEALLHRPAGCRQPDGHACLKVQTTLAERMATNGLRRDPMGQTGGGAEIVVPVPHSRLGRGSRAEPLFTEALVPYQRYLHVMADLSRGKTRNAQKNDPGAFWQGKYIYPPMGFTRLPWPRPARRGGGCGQAGPAGVSKAPRQRPPPPHTAWTRGAGGCLSAGTSCAGPAGGPSPGRSARASPARGWGRACRRRGPAARRR